VSAVSITAVTGTDGIGTDGTRTASSTAVSGGKVTAAAEKHGGDMKTRTVVEAARSVLAVRAISFPTLNCINTSEVIEKRPVVDGLLYPGAWLVVGRPKIGKSWLLLQMALACAEAGSFLGYNCARSEVLAIFSEDDDSRIKSRLTALGVADAPANVHVINQRLLTELAKKFADRYTFVEFLNIWLDAHRDVRLVIIDTEVTVRQVWAGERAQDDGPRITLSDYKQTRAFDEIALRWQIAILLTNHASKRKGEWVDIHEIINRSNTALAGCSGSIALADPPDADPLDPTTKTRILGIRGRDLKDDVMLAVRQQTDMPYFLSEGPYIEVRQTHAEAELMGALEELMIDLPPRVYITSKDLAEAVGKNHHTTKATINRMVRNKRTTWKRFRIVVKQGKGGGLRLDPM
jgi:hypothetical protein